MSNMAIGAQVDLEREKVLSMSNLLYGCLGALFVVFSCWNGLYFDTTFSYAMLYVAAVTIVFLIWIKSTGVSIRGWLLVDYLVLAYFGLYLVSTFAPANMEDAVLGLTRCLAYFLVYFMLRVLASGSGKQQFLLHLLVVSGFLFALYGYANGFGTLHDPNALLNKHDRRFASVFQYSNTYAIYQSVMFLLTVSLGVIHWNKRKFQWFYSIVSYLILGSIIFSYSRGTWLALALMFVLLVLIVPSGFKLRTVFHVVLPLFVTIATMKPLSQAILKIHPAAGWESLLAGAVASVVLTLLVQQVTARVKLSARQIKWVIFSLAICLLVAGVAIVAKVGLPQNIMDRLKSINMQQLSVVIRFQFYKDGLKILSDHPILGGGPNAWAATYQQYQTYPYVSRQSHSFLIDTMMDVGVLGGAVFIGLLVLTIWQGIRMLRRLEQEARFQQSVLLIAFLGLFLHGLIDFDFTYGSINFLFWLLIALLLPKLEVKWPSLVAVHKKLPRYQKSLMIVSWVILVLGVLVSGGYLLSLHEVNLSAANKSNPQLSEQEIIIASDFAPYRATLWISRAQFVADRYEKKKFQRDYDELMSDIQSAVRVAPNDASTLRKAALLSGKYGDDGNQALTLARRAYESAPYEIVYPELNMTFNEQVGTQLYGKNKPLAKQYFTTSVTTYQDVLKRIADFKKLPKILKPEYSYTPTAEMRLTGAEAEYYLGNYKDVIGMVQTTVLGKVTPEEKSKMLALLAASDAKLHAKINPKVNALYKKDKSAQKMYKSLLAIQPLKS